MPVSKNIFFSFKRCFLNIFCFDKYIIAYLM
uniref:Uncharacterized protein n=1 Tax=Anguilla anguilla TaxID=7936 RepID=A0A0E9VXI2_ANGAN